MLNLLWNRYSTILSSSMLYYNLIFCLLWACLWWDVENAVMPYEPHASSHASITAAGAANEKVYVMHDDQLCFSFSIVNHFRMHEQEILSLAAQKSISSVSGKNEAEDANVSRGSLQWGTTMGCRNKDSSFFPVRIREQKGLLGKAKNWKMFSVFRVFLSCPI